MPLLTTKLHMPPLRPSLVPRPRLTSRLDEGFPQALTLISAPAGFGKTTLIGEWQSSTPTGVRLAWLALDENDNDPFRFLTYFITALHQVEPALGEHSLALLQATQPPPPAVILTTLINELAELPPPPEAPPLALVLDDYHFITLPAIHEALAFLVDHFPPNVRLIITTRADPPLPLARWRVRNLLSEIRADDLRFTEQEAAQFLNQVMGLALSAEDITALEDRTEGWVAGLQLAGLSLHGRSDAAGFIRAFSSSPLVVVDYLAEEVLQREPPDIQAFLMQTAVLERLCGDLCETLTGQVDGQMRLEQLRQRNLFVIALDDEGRWYRYHPLFAGVLRLRLRQSRLTSETQLHVRASAWFEQNGLPEEAISHALASQDHALAARLIETNRIHLATSGQAGTLARWIQALPPELYPVRPGLALAHAWVAGQLGDYAGIANHLSAAEQALLQVPEAEARSLWGEISAIRAMLSSFQEEPQALTLARQALAALPDDAAALRLIVAAGLCFGYFRAGELAAAEQTLQQLRASAGGEAVIHLVGVESMLAMVSRLQGRLEVAARFSQQGLQRTNLGGRPLLDAGTILAYAVLSKVEYERGAFTEAEAHLRLCAEMAGQTKNLGIQLYALTELARLALAREAPDLARSWLAQAGALSPQTALTPTNQATLGAMRAHIWIAEGKPAKAERWAQEQPRPGGEMGPPLAPYDFHRLLLPEAQLALGRSTAAIHSLHPLIAQAEETGHGDYLVKALSLLSIAFQQAGKTSQALLALKRALTLAEPERYVTVFIERGQTMRALLTQITGEQRRYAQHLLAYFGASGTASQPPTRDSHPLEPAAAPLSEPLSPRELEILRLVAQGLSDREVAETLVVVTGTVKKHLSNIYIKLGVGSRTQALARARQLGLF